jgi:hypothetical protein
METLMRLIEGGAQNMGDSSHPGADGDLGDHLLELALTFCMGPQMTAFGAFLFVVLAVSALDVGEFSGGAIAQSALLDMLPWHQTSG